MPTEDVTLIPVKARHAKVDRISWWDTEESLDFGAGPLLYRCMREYYWSKDYALRVLKGYRQFLELKKILEDWDAKIVSASAPVNQMWHQHILDVANYCHDCILLCGKVIGNDPDAALDEWTHDKKIVATTQLLRARFEFDIDYEIWSFEEFSNGREGPEPSHHRTPSVCMSGLTAEDKRHGATSDDRYRYPSSLVSGSAYVSSRPASRSKSGVASGRTGRDPALYEQRDDAEYSRSSSSRRRATKQDSVLIHDVQDNREIEVEEDADFPIRVRTLKGSIYSLTVNKAMTIHQVKKDIQRQYGVAEDKQHLLFFGKVLDNDATLGEYNVPPDSGFQLLIRSKAGGGATTL